MSKVAVVYKSKYGSTKKYAQWIADAVQADLFKCSEVKIDNLTSYGTIVFGGGLYASGINGVSVITKNFEVLKDKNLIIFTVGLAPTEDREIFEPIIKKNCTERIRNKIQFFHLRGGIDYKELGLVHKAMMSMVKKMVANKKEEELTEDDKMMLETYGEKVDFTDIQTIAPMVTYIRSLNK